MAVSSKFVRQILPAKPRCIGKKRIGKTVPRILLVSDQVFGYEKIIKATKRFGAHSDHVTVVPVNYLWSMKRLMEEIADRCGDPEHQYHSIGIFAHGSPGRIHLVKGPHGEEGFHILDMLKNKVFKKFAELLVNHLKTTRKGPNDHNHRIDIFCCSVLDYDDGLLHLAKLESKFAVNWSASDNPTGNPGAGITDWIMESDPYLGSIKKFYFDNSITNWPPCPPVWKKKAVLEKNKAVKKKMKPHVARVKDSRKTKNAEDEAARRPGACGVQYLRDHVQRKAEHR